MIIKIEHSTSCYIQFCAHRPWLAGIMFFGITSGRERGFCLSEIYNERSILKSASYSIRIYFSPLQLSFPVMMKMDLPNQMMEFLNLNVQNCCRVIVLILKKQIKSLTSFSQKSHWKTMWKAVQSRQSSFWPTYCYTIPLIYLYRVYFCLHIRTSVKCLVQIPLAPAKEQLQ